MLGRASSTLRKALPMRLTRLRSNCPDTETCPTLYRTDRGMAAEVLESQHVAEHRTATEVAWELGIDFTTWWNGHPQHHRSTHRVA